MDSDWLLTECNEQWFSRQDPVRPKMTDIPLNLLRHSLTLSVLWPHNFHQLKMMRLWNQTYHDERLSNTLVSQSELFLECTIEAFEVNNTAH
jgi:hypothetical protein